jgi:uncharacterized delta-60 repeat protein
MAFSMMLYGAGAMPAGGYWMTTLAQSGDEYEFGYSVAMDSNDNVYMVGNIGPSGSYDAFMAKYDSAGTIQWQQTLSGGQSTEEFVSDMAIDSNNNVYVTGYTRIDAGTSWLLIYKYNSEGVIQWQQTLGNGIFGDTGTAITIDSSDNVYVCGRFVNYFQLVKYDSAGVVQWQIQTSDNAQGRAVTTDSSGNVYAFGTNDSYDIMLVKYDSAGNFQWEKGLDSNGINEPAEITTDSNDNIYMTGYLYGAILIMKFNTEGVIQWQRTLSGAEDDTSYTIAIDSSDNVYVGGSSRSVFNAGAGSSYLRNSIIFKYNSSGEIQWQRSISGEYTDQIAGVAIDSRDNVYVTGYTRSTSSKDDIFLAKLPNDGSLTGTYSLGDISFAYAETFLETGTPALVTTVGTAVFGPAALPSQASDLTLANSELTGSFVKLIKPPIEYWVSILGGGDNTGYITRTMAIDSANNIYVGGYNLSDPVNGPNLLLIKRDPLGAVIWQRILTGAQDDVGFAVVVDLADNVYISGYTISGGAGSLDFIVVKYNPSGEVVWQKFLGGPSVDIGYSLAVDSANNLIVAGQGFTGLGNYDYSVSKLDSSGNQIWQAVIGGTEADTVRGVAVDSEDSIYVFGYSASEPAQNANMLLVKYNSAGDIQWGRLLGGYNFEQGNAIAIDASDDIFIVGGSASTGVGGYDMITAKLDKSGNIYWQRALGGAANDMGQSIAIDSLGNVYVCGWTQSQGTGPVTMIIARYDTFGNLIFQRVLYGVGTEYSYDIAIDSNDDIVITGATNSVTLDATESITIRLPNNGALTGQIQINGATFTYEAGELTPSVSELTFELSTLTLGTPAFTSSDSNLVSSSTAIPATVVLI